MKRLFAPLAALVDLLRSAPSCGGDCSGGRRPCNCRSAASEITRSPARCVACRQALGDGHATGCQFAPFTIRRAQ